MFILVNDYGPYVISALILISLLNDRLVPAPRPGLTSPVKSNGRTAGLTWDSSLDSVLIVLLVSGIFTSGLLMQHYMRR